MMELLKAIEYKYLLLEKKSIEKLVAFARTRVCMICEKIRTVERNAVQYRAAKSKSESLIQLSREGNRIIGRGAGGEVARR